MSPFLIVLHPRLLVFYSLALSSGQLGLTAVSQHSLSHTSHSMIIGRFGKTNDQLVCVQSLDGRLTFFDFSGEVLHYNLPNFLLSGPLVYIFRTDTFLVASSGRSLEAYRYQTLCSVSKVKKSKVSDERVKIKGVKYGIMAFINLFSPSPSFFLLSSFPPPSLPLSPQCDWSLPLNEPVVDMKVITTDSGPWYVMVLGERNLYCIEDLGALQFSKKLESISTCVLPYKFGKLVKFSVYLSTSTPSLLYHLVNYYSFISHWKFFICPSLSFSFHSSLSVFSLSLPFLSPLPPPPLLLSFPLPLSPLPLPLPPQWVLLLLLLTTC